MRVRVRACPAGGAPGVGVRGGRHPSAGLAGSIELIVAADWGWHCWEALCAALAGSVLAGLGDVLRNACAGGRCL